MKRMQNPQRIAMFTRSAADRRAALAGPADTEVRPLRDEDEQSWEDFVTRAPGASFFHRPAWNRAVARACGHDVLNLGAWQEGQLIGILPLTHIRSRLFGDALISVGFAVYGGIVAEDDEAAQALAFAAARAGRRLRVGHIELRHDRPSPLAWNVKSDLYATFMRKISASDDENLMAIPRKKRADLRKAIDNPKLRMDADPDLDTFFRIYAESVRNLVTPVFPRELFAAIKHESGELVEISAVIGPGGPVAAVMSFYIKDQVLPYFGGATPAARPLHAYDLLYWGVMRRAAARGCRIYDFGRSKRGTGSFDYKTFWGFEPRPLHYQYLPVGTAAIPEINPADGSGVEAFADAAGQCARPGYSATARLRRGAMPHISGAKNSPPGSGNASRRDIAASYVFSSAIAPYAAAAPASMAASMADKPVLRSAGKCLMGMRHLSWRHVAGILPPCG